MKFAKAVIAGVGAIVSVLTLVFADDVVNASEAGTIAAVITENIITVILVAATRNKGFYHESEIPKPPLPTGWKE